ncbi:MAG: helix-turn-helix domain-containing protein [Clostridiales bacterium]|nr:helix-turn-helix domain-containing protein [Clostridiales bacterium]
MNLDNFFRKNIVGLKNYSKLLYIYLSYMTEDQESVKLRVRDIGRDLDFWPGTVNEAIKELKAKGYIEVNRGKPSEYRVIK